jgi:putative FmdB family regulatory protein
VPTYDYLCKACGHALELFQSMSEAARRKCPACGKLALQRQIGTGAGFVFKGSGFYQTDYRSESYKKGAADDGGSGSKGGEAKSEAKKPAKKPAKGD